MNVAADTAVTINYTLTNDSGEVLETSQGRDPLTYIHGAGRLIKGLEVAMDGKSPKDAFTVRIGPEDAYGDYRKDLVFEVPKSQFQEFDGLEVGIPLRVQTPNGAMVVTVGEIGDDSVILDGNHPLAGIALTFNIELLDVRDATAEELDEVRQPAACAGSCGESCGEGCGDESSHGGCCC
jgi:FKBP-type peptidyl-prolyl cis-trans isomerase SlyD